MSGWNNVHLSLLLLALGSALALSLWKETKSAHPKVEPFFLRIDTACIHSIGFARNNNKDTIWLRRSFQHWQLNERFNVNPTLLKSFLHLLTRVVKGHVVKREELSENDIKDTLSLSLGHPNREAETYTIYLTHTENVLGRYQHQNKWFYLRVPGYLSHWVSLFQLSENQWRRRLIFSSFFLDHIQTISLQYTQNPIQSWTLRADSTHTWLIDKKPVQATLMPKIADYLAQYPLFKINEFISDGQVVRYDSLMKTTPFARLRILSPKDTTQIQLYTCPNEPYTLVERNGMEYALCETERLKALLIKKSVWVPIKDSLILD